MEEQTVKSQEQSLIPDNKNDLQIQYIAKQNRILLFTAIAAISSVVIAAVSIYFTFITTERSLQISNKPLVILSEKQLSDGNSIVLWNCGPGVAYNINVEVHLADNIGNIGYPWVTDVIEAALNLETKTKDQLFINMNTSNNWWDIRNHSTVLPAGIENGYLSSVFSTPALHGIYVIVRFSDVLKNKYYSVWDGFEWKFGEGEPDNVKPEYPEQKWKSSTPVTQFWHHLSHALYGKNPRQVGLPLPYPEWRSKIAERPYYDWLLKEAKYLKDNGYGDIPLQIKKVNEEMLRMKLLNENNYVPMNVK